MIPICLARSDRFNPVQHNPCTKTGRWGLGMMNRVEGLTPWNRA